MKLYFLPEGYGYHMVTIVSNRVCRYCTDVEIANVRYEKIKTNYIWPHAEILREKDFFPSGSKARHKFWQDYCVSDCVSLVFDRNHKTMISKYLYSDALTHIGKGFVGRTSSKDLAEMILNNIKLEDLAEALLYKHPVAMWLRDKKYL